MTTPMSGSSLASLKHRIISSVVSGRKAFLFSGRFNRYLHSGSQVFRMRICVCPAAQQNIDVKVVWLSASIDSIRLPTVMCTEMCSQWAYKQDNSYLCNALAFSLLILDVLKRLTMHHVRMLLQEAACCETLPCTLRHIVLCKLVWKTLTSRSSANEYINKSQHKYFFHISTSVLCTFRYDEVAPGSHIVRSHPADV